ncbi:MAG: NUDIX domain-containing protein, partial [Ruminococcus sp.]
MRRTKDDKGRTLEEFLSTYSPKDYPRPSVTVDMILFSIKENNISVLLIKRGGHPYLDYWALPGGFTESKETVYESAERELFEETNLKDIPLEELGVFSEPSRDPRSWTMTDAFFSVVDRDKIAPKAGDDA